MKQLILGAGNMIQALLPSYITEAKKDGVEFFVYTPSGKSAKAFAQSNDVNFLSTISEIGSHDFDLVWLAMKPQGFEAAMLEFQEQGIDFSSATAVSIMAGVSVQTLKAISHAKEVVRIMPNTPSKVNIGVNLIYSSLSKSDLENKFSYFNTSCENFFLETEQMIDNITPFSGSGPAYFFEFSRVFEEKMVSLGLDSISAKRISALTMKGASQMILDDSDSSQELRNKVTSKGGVTFEALKVFKERNIQDIFDQAIDSALKRNSELKGE